MSDEATVFVPTIPVTVTGTFIDARFGPVKAAMVYARCIAQLRQRGQDYTAVFWVEGSGQDDRKIRLPGEFWTYEAYRKPQFIIITQYLGIYAVPCPLPRDAAVAFCQKLLLDGGEFLFF